MSDPIKHECGVAFIRLLKPLQYYHDKYGSALYGLKKLYLLMEKQHNRGQDGAGVATIKLDPEPGTKYISRQRSTSKNAIAEIFQKVFHNFEEIKDKNNLHNGDWLKKNVSYAGELLLGHLRYGTFGGSSIEFCHPFLRQNNWMSRNLVLAGNFNVTNVDELFQQLVALGQHPKEKADTVTMLEKIGHFLDEENQELFDEYKARSYSNNEISTLIAANLKPEKVLRKALKNIDGGYMMAGLIGHGDAFAVRDPNGIRPGFYYYDDEIAVVTSERPAIQTAFNIPIEKIREIDPGHALIIKKNGKVSLEKIIEPRIKTSCSFERIYFSRGNDADIYKERKKLGTLLCSTVLKAINYDLKNTVFSYIPNTAATAFYGMMDGVLDYLAGYKKDEILKIGAGITPQQLEEILAIRPRREKIAVKDAKLRTFITDDSHRDDMVAHVYDVTYGCVRDDIDTLVVIDDSIVRGTTLKNSIIKILDRLGPKKIIIVSSAPQIRYPDCYGIDMSKLKDFVAFQAMVALVKETKQEAKLQEVYEKCKSQQILPKEQISNYVKELYDLFTDEELSKKISQIIRLDDVKAEVEVIYQTVENLHIACPGHSGDWYFSGNFPTPGGNRVINNAYINYMEGRNERGY
jgi:amidophosphoribosyltransferase